MLVRPSRIATVRPTCSDTNASWVTITIVVPSSRLTRRSSPNTSADVRLSSSPVGSSARITLGSLARATAIATRCCSPPDSRSGRCAARSAIPTRSRSSSARRPPALPAVEHHRQLHVVDRRQVREQVPPGLLPDEPDGPTAEPRAVRVAHPAEVVARHDGPARGRDIHAAEDGEQRRLAAPRCADDGDHLAAVDEEVEALERDDLELGQLEDADETVADDDGPVPIPEARSRAERGAREGIGTVVDGRRVRHHADLPRSAATGATRRWSAAPSRSPNATTAVIMTRITSRTGGIEDDRHLDRGADEGPQAQDGPQEGEQRRPRGVRRRRTRPASSARALPPAGPATGAP